MFQYEIGKNFTDSNFVVSQDRSPRYLGGNPAAHELEVCCLEDDVLGTSSKWENSIHAMKEMNN